MELTTSTISLPAIEPYWAQQIRADPQLLANIAHAVRGPFHVLYPALFTENLTALKNTLVGAGVEGEVYFGKKANKAACWLSACAEADAGVDVASVPELVHTLGHGVRGEDIMITGAAKSEELLWLAARHRCLIAVDALDELERVIVMARLNTMVRILLRVLPDINPRSRFGLNAAELDGALERCVQERERVIMEGFSFHLNGYEVAPRASLASDLIDRCVAARTQGLIANSISIGGGFAASYLDVADWKRFNEDYQSSWFHGNKTFTHFYPYYQAPTGADMLAAILASATGGDCTSLSIKFAQTGSRLFLEPGRALLDRCGFTVFPVQGFKKMGDYGIVTVAGLSASVSEQWKGSEYLPEPILWPSTEAGDPVDACVGGASCLEYDMLSWRKIPFPRAPHYGDLLIYPNTAGYQMDKNETGFHLLPLPAKVVVSHTGNQFLWQLDERA